MVDIDFVPSLIESFIEVTLGILLGKIVPLLDDIHGGLKGVLLSQDIVAIILSSLIFALLGVLCKDAAHVVLILRSGMLLGNGTDLVHFGVGIIEFLV